MVYGQYGPLGRLVNKLLRKLGKVIPFRSMNTFVENFAFFRNHEYSILDMMYVETELHFSSDVILAALENWGLKRYVFTNLQNGINIEFSLQECCLAKKLIT